MKISPFGAVLVRADRRSNGWPDRQAVCLSARTNTAPNGLIFRKILFDYFWKKTCGKKNQALFKSNKNNENFA
jgi:hypothetical protein